MMDLFAFYTSLLAAGWFSGIHNNAAVLFFRSLIQVDTLLNRPIESTKLCCYLSNRFAAAIELKKMELRLFFCNTDTAERSVHY